MSLYFSPATLGFYDSSIHANMPDDASEISAELHRTLLEQESEGRVLAADLDGHPITVDPVHSAEELLISMRRRRDVLLRESDHTQMADYPISAELRAAWAVFRQQLRDLPETITDPADISWLVPPTGE